MAHAIDRIGTWKKLPARREPYWGSPIGNGSDEDGSLYLGLRKLESGTCRWIARIRAKDGTKLYRSLGRATEANGYLAAKKAAEAWHKDAVRGVAVDGQSTVADACHAYVEALRDGLAGNKAAERSAEARKVVAAEVAARFRRHIYGSEQGKRKVSPNPIAKVRLDRLRTAHLRRWRAGIGGSPANGNRYWTTLAAALNLAVENRLVSAAASVEWRAVKQARIAPARVGLDEVVGRRRLYLTLSQRRALIEASTGGLRDLIELAALTGARPGELASARRSSFDERVGTLKVSGKTGPRVVQLAPAAIALCKRLAQSKLPGAPLVMQDDGQPWVRWNWDQLVRAAALRAKLPPGVVLYTLRHSWISDACRNGMPLLEVARLSGTSLQMIESSYGHVTDDDALRARLAALPMP